MIYQYPDIPVQVIRDMPIEKKPKGNPGRKKRPKYLACVCAFDIETSSIRKIKQAFMYIWQFQIGPEVTIIGRTWPDFLGLLGDLARIHPDTKYVTFVHNLSFEFTFLSGIWNFAPEDVFCTDPRQVLRADMGPLELRCSYRLTNMSLLQFTRQMKVKHAKLSGERFDYNKIRYPWSKLSPYELAYCVNDVIGLVEAVITQMANDGDTLYTLPLTSTGYVRRDIKKAMKTFNWNTMHRLVPPYSVHTRLKQAFRGGNTHANRHIVGQLLHDVHSYDMASAYPSAQINKEFPMGRWYEVDPERVTPEYLHDLIHRRHKALIVEVAFMDIGLRDPRWPVPYLAVDKCRHILPVLNEAGENVSYDNGRILSARYLETTLTDIDLKIVLDEYDAAKMEIKYIAFSTYGKLPAQYRECVLDYYHKKTTLKGIKSQEWLYIKSKGKLNAIYGCSVQDPLQISYDYLADLQPVPYQVKEEDPEEIYNKYTKYAFSSYAWGVWTTAYCRQRLEAAIRLIYEEGEKQKKRGEPIKTIFCYCDTDSVKFIGPCDFEQINHEYREESKKNNGFAVDPKGKEHYLGVYEYEGKAADWITWGAKKYVYRLDSDLQTVAGAGDTWHITIAGVAKTEGARELERKGGVEALLAKEDGKPFFVFEDAGGTEAIYNDFPEITEYKVKGRKIPITRNLYLEKHPYTLSITDSFLDIIYHPDLWRDLLDARPEV